MFKIMVVTTLAGGQGVSVATTVVDFDTIEEAQSAIEIVFGCNVTDSRLQQTAYLLTHVDKTV